MEKFIKLIFLFVLLLGSKNLLSQGTPLDSIYLNFDSLAINPNASSLGPTWLFGGNVALNFSQVSLNNWAGGGENSFSVNSILNFFSKYKKGNNSWDNSLLFGYGLTKQGSGGFIKNDDRLDITSKYGHKSSKNWFYSALINLRTQVDEGFENEGTPDEKKISDAFAPAFMLISIGMDYKPNKNFSLYISPATGKLTFVNNQILADAGAFGVDSAEFNTDGVKVRDGRKFRSQFGGYFKLEFKEEIAKNVTLLTKLDLFSDYENKPQNIDVNWELLINMKVNSFLSASLSALMIYDDDIKIDTDNDQIPNGARLQFKQVFGAGFTFKF